MATSVERAGEADERQDGRPERTFSVGTRLGEGGRYELRKLVGTGAMAEVYKAVDKRLGDRIVAIKTLSRSVGDHPFADKLRQLFIQEARAIARVKDDHVVSVLDFGTTSEGTPYMVMEFLSGTDLGAYLKKVDRLDIAEAVDTVLAVCAGVQACHLAGIVHRDLKPANIFLARTANGDEPKVLDFSVAKLPVVIAPAVERSTTDLIVGTPSYMSPETAIGKPAGPLSDQYSIGAVLYRCLTGRPPQDVPPRLRELRPEVPARLEEIILRAIAPAAGKRFPSVHDLGRALLPFASAPARGRWSAYYRNIPTIIDPTLSEPVASPVGAPSTVGAKPPARMLSLAGPGATTTDWEESTTVLIAPDWGAAAAVRQDQVAPKASAAEAAEPRPSSPMVVVDPFASTGRQTRAGAARDLTVRITRTLQGARGAWRSRVPHAPLLLPFGMAVLLLVTFAFAGMRLGRTRHPAPPLVSPPLWAGPARPAPAAVAARAAPMPSAGPPSPSPARDQDEGPPPSPSPATPPAPPVDVPPRRHPRHHATTLYALPLGYGPFGAPILR